VFPHYRYIELRNSNGKGPVIQVGLEKFAIFSLKTENAYQEYCSTAKKERKKELYLPSKNK